MQVTICDRCSERVTGAVMPQYEVTVTDETVAPRTWELCNGCSVAFDAWVGVPVDEAHVPKPRVDA